MTVVKHKAWQVKVAAHLGEEFSEELTRTYLTYNSPTCPAEKESIEKLKRDQILSPNHERYPNISHVLPLFYQFSNYLLQFCLGSILFVTLLSALAFFNSQEVGMAGKIIYINRFPMQL